MSSQIRLYAGFIVLTAFIAAAAVFVAAPGYSPSYLQATLGFAALAALSQLLSHRIGEDTSGSIASIPYLASVVVAPHWLPVVAIAVSTAVVARTRKGATVKTVFNTAQITLAVSLAVLVYRALGGVSLLEERTFPALPYAALVVVFFFVNTVAVSGAIAITEEKSVVAVWKKITSGALVYDCLASPLAFIFAWVYVSHGAVWTAGLAVPLLAVRQIFKTNWQLEQVNQELLQLMVKAIEARDPYTSGHSRRVAHYSRIIARAVGLKAKQVERVATAALLHDVGKIHEIYAPILRKPDKLTPDERITMETHPIKSAELIQTVSQLRDLIGPVRHHHENWDGTGYPDGLAGETIPLGARIIMVADTIDAMLTDRPYRKALGEEEVRRELGRLRGRQFDPHLCDILLSNAQFGQILRRAQSQTPPQLTIVPSSPRTARTGT